MEVQSHLFSRWNLGILRQHSVTTDPDLSSCKGPYICDVASNVVELWVGKRHPRLEGFGSISNDSFGLASWPTFGESSLSVQVHVSKHIENRVWTTLLVINLWKHDMVRTQSWEAKGFLVWGILQWPVVDNVFPVQLAKEQNEEISGEPTLSLLCKAAATCYYANEWRGTCAV